jgi:hypothetical protein
VIGNSMQPSELSKFSLGPSAFAGWFTHSTVHTPEMKLVCVRLSAKAILVQALRARWPPAQVNLRNAFQPG